ncbi:ABC transporter permease [Chelatococcus asaccharovorans]|uniref:Peptide/nickel transport system permease protein n=1 Tax=Chelatococcus asaccharovorans TaxID=28210 RepID=A0A2V3UI95_9HYPH|nr:ABC transporter permease [Chelatococcus asaccharovorans]MBS7706267.1 ABC transporter permease [Chelatococcus asaccharovorans]PXW65095.1 peptide/nickel transport system permease protein [Chelatococcus asaccharovorans]
MSDPTQQALAALARPRSKGSRFLRLVRRNPFVPIGGGVVVLFALTALFAPWLAPKNPQMIDVVNRLLPPGPGHWMGTDEYGRDILSRVIHGSRISMSVAVLVVILSALMGVVLGILSAYYRKLDNIIMRMVDGLMAFPEILLAISIVATLGPSKGNVVAALCVVYTPLIARVVRASALVERERTYVEAMEVMGAHPLRVMFLNILPNCTAPLIVQLTFIFAQSIIVEASLSFLGAGTPPQYPSWGNILSEGVIVMQEAWWQTAFPGLCILVVVMALNLMGDGLRDVLDPHNISRR